MSDFEKWVDLGIKNGWISPAYCSTHDGGYEYLTDEEKMDYDEGLDVCEPVFRILDV